MDGKRLLKDILPILLGQVTIYEENHRSADGWFKDLYKGYTREIPETLWNREVCIIRGGKSGLDIQIEKEEERRKKVHEKTLRQQGNFSISDETNQL